MKCEEIRLTMEDGEEARRLYFDGIRKVVEEKFEASVEERKKFMPPENFAANPEEYRRKFIEMLGWPLTEYREGKCVPFKKELIEELPFLKIYRLSLETLPGLWFEGIIYEPTNRSRKCPLLINHPGGGYCVENLIPHGEYKCEQYKDIGVRFLDEGMLMYAPQNFIWREQECRIRFDAQLKAIGGSMTGLEVYNTKCAIDYFIANEQIDPERIGMFGLSYGGYYTMYTSAADSRVRVSFVSCIIRNAYKEREGFWREVCWQNSAHMFGMAEVAALIAPRPLFIEEGFGDNDYLAAIEEEYERLKAYYEAANVADNLLIYKGDGGHEIQNGDVGFDFFVKHLMDEKER